MFFLAESHNTGDSTPYLQAEGERISELQQAGIVETVLLKADRFWRDHPAARRRRGGRARRPPRPAASS